MNTFQNKEQIITEYLRNINWKGNWSYKKIQSDLKNLIGEEPAIEILYKKDVMVNELNSEVKEVRKIKGIDIIYSPDLDNSFKKLSFDINI
jgi:hypothetical protein